MRLRFWLLSLIALSGLLSLKWWGRPAFSQPDPDQVSPPIVQTSSKPEGTRSDLATAELKSPVPQSPQKSLGMVPLLIPGLERFTVNPDTERYVSALPFSPEVKKLFLSAHVIRNVAFFEHPSDYFKALDEFQKETRIHKDAILSALQGLSADQGSFPEGFRRELMTLTALLGESHSPAVQKLALTEIASLQANGSLQSSEEQLTLTQSITSYAFAAKDQATALATVQGQLDPNDRIQQRSFARAQQLLAKQINSVGDQ